jgi:site-specific DNA-methyltransferase (adenine-specific)
VTNATIHHGDVLEVLRTFKSASFDALLCDPPAGISFMGKEWDKDKGGRKQWIRWLAKIMRQAFRVLKPGSHILVWALPRTSHWTATAIEDAGFEIRDVVTHLFASGFPKSLDVSKAIDRELGEPRDETSAKTDDAKRFAGYGTALKPASEHWILARKPPKTTVAANAIKHGTGGLAIDACRISHASAKDLASHEASVAAIKARGGSMANSWKNSSDLAGANDVSTLGRWPANLMLSHSDECRPIGTKIAKGHKGYPNGPGGKSPLFMGESKTESRTTPHAGVPDAEAVAYDCAPGCPVKLLDEQSGDRPGMSGGGVHRADYAGGMFGGIDSATTARGDSGGASRFFFVAKPSRFERELGCEGLPLKSPGEATGREDGSDGLNSPRAGAGRTGGSRNYHPTLKAITLTSELAKLIMPPKSGRILCPFAGSGSEVIGAMRAGWDEIHGIEREEEFVTIARARIARWSEVPAHLSVDEIIEAAERGGDKRQEPLFK